MKDINDPVEFYEFQEKVDELIEATASIRKMQFEKPESPNCRFCGYKFICNNRLI